VVIGRDDALLGLLGLLGLLVLTFLDELLTERVEFERVVGQLARHEAVEIR
jgi:hypothetical protein